MPLGRGTRKAEISQGEGFEALAASGANGAKLGLDGREGRV